MPRPDNAEVVESLKNNPVVIGTHGRLALVDCMGDDLAIVEAARTSYGADEICDEGDMTDKDVALLRYLLRHKHTTPFEMCEIKFFVRVPIDTFRQWARHRTANINEYSTRYKEALNCQDVPSKYEWRRQSQSNKQGSSGTFLSIDGYHMCENAAGTVINTRRVYDSLVKRGVALEQARRILPMCTYTQAYWKCDLHNIFNFLRLRMDHHAQKEIRDFAVAMGDMVSKLFPVAYQAFQDYILQSMTLTRLDLIAIQNCTLSHFTNAREREECQEKLRMLGITVPASTH